MGRAFEYRRAAKEKRWDKMSKVFPRLGKNITLAAKEGGPDPALNARLRNAIMAAKAENMPKDNIDAAIKRATGKDAESLVDLVYEGKGPHGVLVVIETATDNTTRTVANVRSYFNKAGGSFVPAGSLDFMFTRKAVFEFILPEGMDQEELEFELIDAGLESMENEEERLIAYAEFTQYGNLSKALDEKGVDVTKATLERIPNSTAEFTEEQLEEIEKMLDKIEEDDDVQHVFTNVA